MGFALGVLIQRLEVNCLSGCAILLGAYDHPQTICDRDSDFDFLHYTYSYISFDVRQSLILEVKRYRYGSVVCYWFCVWL